MTLAIQTNTGGAGAGDVNANLAGMHLISIANLDTGLGFAPDVGNLQPVTYARTVTGVCPTRLDSLVNTNFGVNATADVVVLAVGGNFVLNDNTLITTRGGTALPVGNQLNPSTSCLVIYDTSDNNNAGYCVARNGSGGVQDLPMPLSVLLYHELSHAFRIVTSGLLQLGGPCNPASPEENAAIVDENDMRTQLAATLGNPVALRDPAIHCGGTCGVGGGGGGCCIVASVATGSPLSTEVDALRAIRDGLLRRTDIGFAFFRELHRAYYAFSPQVATRIAGNQVLRETVRVGFVEPLVHMLTVAETCLLDGRDDETVATVFVDGLQLSDGMPSVLELDRALQTCAGASTEILDPDEQWLADLLTEKAMSDPHVMWALIEPVRIFRTSIQHYLDGCRSQDLGKKIRQQLCDWAGEMPIGEDWGAYDREEVRYHLDALNSTLLRYPITQTRFHERLGQRFAGVTAIDEVVNHETGMSNEEGRCHGS